MQPPQEGENNRGLYSRMVGNRGASQHLRSILKAYASYYNEVRTDLSLDNDPPDFPRAQKFGRISAIPILGGLHHQYVRD